MVRSVVGVHAPLIARAESVHIAAVRALRIEAPFKTSIIADVVVAPIDAPVHAFEHPGAIAFGHTAVPAGPGGPGGWDALGRIAVERFAEASFRASLIYLIGCGVGAYGARGIAGDLDPSSVDVPVISAAACFPDPI